MGFLFQIFSFFFTNNPVRTQGSKHFSESPACDFSDPSDLLNLRFRWRILSGKRGAFLNWKPSFWGTHKGILQKKKGWKKFQFHIIPNGLIVIFIPWDPFFPKKKNHRKNKTTPHNRTVKLVMTLEKLQMNESFQPIISHWEWYFVICFK